MEIRKSSFLGKTPEIGSIVVFNPPRYKGLVVGYVIGFMPKSGLPKVITEEFYPKLKEEHKELFSFNTNTGFTEFLGGDKETYYETPKTGFEIVGHIFGD